MLTYKYVVTQHTHTQTCGHEYSSTINNERGIQLGGGKMRSGRAPSPTMFAMTRFQPLYKYCITVHTATA